MDKQATLDAVEKTLDVVEEQIETVARIPKVHLNGTTKQQQFIILGVTTTVGVIIGIVFGYKASQGRLKLKYEKIANDEIAGAKSFYGRLHKTDEELQSPEKVLKEKGMNRGSVTLKNKADEALKSYQADEPIRTSIFDKMIPDFNYDSELEERTPEKPYVISYDEYFEEEPGYEQASLTYYMGDGVLSDEKDDVVPETTVGEDNLVKFGYGSKDENLVYVRSETLQIDFEISRSMGSYAEEVHGIARGRGD